MTEISIEMHARVRNCVLFLHRSKKISPLGCEILMTVRCSVWQCGWKQTQPARDHHHGNDHKIPEASACARLFGNNWTRYVIGPFVGGQTLRKPAQRLFQALDIDPGASLQRRQLLAVVENARTDSRKWHAFEFCVLARNLEKLVDA